MSNLNKVKKRFLPIHESVIKGLENEPKIDDFEVWKVLGVGSFGKVYSAMHKDTKIVYAIKEINKNNKNNQDGKPYFRREIEIMYKVRHPNVVKLYSHFEDDNNCYFVMEYINQGSLFQIVSVEKSNSFEVKQVALIMKELISAIYYWHNMEPSIIHRDIKPENVWIDDNGHTKWTDFGWSNYVNTEIRSTYCGTPVYLAPEMIKEIGHDEHLDIWCLGVLMFELLTGTVPFKGKDLNSLNNNIWNWKILWPKDINLDAKNLISKILKPEPQDRLSLVDMWKHPFFTKHLVNPVEGLMLPDKNDNIKSFVLSKDKPEIKPTEETKVSNPPVNNEKTNNNNNNNNNNTTETNINTIRKINSNHNLYDYMNINMNIKEWYDKLKLDYENLTFSYNEWVISKSEINKKFEDMCQKESFLKREKESLLKEIEERDNKKFDLLKQNAELTQLISEKDDTIALLKKQLSWLNDSKSKDQADYVTKINNYEVWLSAKSDSEAQLKERIESWENELKEQRNFFNAPSNINNNNNDIIYNNEMFNKRMSLPIEQGKNKAEFEDYKKKMENEITIRKEYFENEIENLRNEMKKEKEKSNMIIKHKDDEIKKLSKGQIDIKEQECKKYEKVINKYEETLKWRESEIEVWKLKIKKCEIMLNTYSAKK